MEYEKIKQIMEDMGNSKLSSMDIEFQDGTKISMRKDNEVVVASNPSPTVIVEKEEKVNVEVVEDKGNIITSPMVGTFYSKPSPTDDPYVSINKSVSIGDTVCIIEAMKLMNEIESEFSGKITEIFVNDGDAVEYGTKLFRVE